MSDIKIPEMDFNKSKNIIMIVAVVAVIVVIFIFGKNIVGFIENLFGADDAQSAAARQFVTGYNASSTNPSSPFNPQMYLNTPGGSNLISDADATTAAAQVYDADGWFTTDAGEALAAFNTFCKSQADVSKVSAWFSKLASTDMYNFMTKEFTSKTNIETLQQIINYCTSLPVNN